MIVDIRNLAHAYKSHQALTNVNFSIGEESIHGFVGPNGAGKTTTLKILATLLRPKTGSVKVFGLDVVEDYKEVRTNIGYMQDHFSMYRQMTVFEYLDFFGAAYGLTTEERNRTIADVLELTDMGGRKGSLIKGLSRGMQQRVSLARALVHDPKLLLLDEPASGLDPRARIELMEILEALRDLGKTIFISSHILSELATLCDHVTIVDHGEVKYTGTMEGLVNGDGAITDYRIRVAGDPADIIPHLQSLNGVEQVEQDEKSDFIRVSIDPEKSGPNALLQAAINKGAEIVSFEEDTKHLNQAFMDLTSPGVRTASGLKPEPEQSDSDS